MLASQLSRILRSESRISTLRVVYWPRTRPLDFCFGKAQFTCMRNFDYIRQCA